MTTSMKKLPMILMMRRVSIRIFPGGVSVGLYYNDDLNKYFSIAQSSNSILEVKEYEFNQDNS